MDRNEREEVRQLIPRTEYRGWVRAFIVSSLLLLSYCGVMLQYEWHPHTVEPWYFGITASMTIWCFLLITISVSLITIMVSGIAPDDPNKPIE